MLKKWRSRWNEWNQALPELAWLQVEVTTVCNARCSYCPRTTAGDAWLNRHMDPALFRAAIAALPHIPYVHLQGWGEPLLHPEFFTLVGLTRQAGSQCGATSNGVPVDAAMARRLVDSGLQVLGLSLTGTGEDHDRYRPGAALAQVKSALHCLAAARLAAKQATPSVHIAYLLMADGIDGLQRLPELLAGEPVSQVVISTLDYVPAPALAGQVITAGTPLARLAGERVEAVRRQLAVQGIAVACSLIDTPDPAAYRTCAEQVHQSLFLGIDGQIFPCVFAKLGSLADRDGLSFGNLQAAKLPSVWNSAPYRRFRASFASGDVHDLCRDCPKRAGR